MFASSPRNASRPSPLAAVFASLVLLALLAFVGWRSRGSSTPTREGVEAAGDRAKSAQPVRLESARPRAAMLPVARQREPALHADASSRRSPAEAAAAEDEATVSGSVTDASGGPIGGALVSAREDSKVIASTLSDEAGAFELALPPGSFVLVARAEAYSDAYDWIRVPARGVQLTLAPGATLSGRVLGAGTGLLIADVTVTAEGPEGTSVATRTAQTDHAGMFSFSALAPGRYQLEASGPEWRSQRQTESVAVGEQRGDIELRAMPAGVLEAQVLAAGDPCNDGFVRLSGPAWSNTAVQHGTARVEGVIPGTYSVEVGCTDALTFSESVELGLGHSLRRWDLSAGLRLRGRVQTASGEAFAGAAVRVLPKEGSPGVNVDCRADAVGVFECRALVSGDYRVEAVGPTSALSDPLELHLAGDMDGVVLRASPFGTIVASLANGTDGAAPAIFARRAGQLAVPAQRNASDEFVFEQLPLGAYTVFIQDERPSPGNSTVAQLERVDQVVRVTLRAPPTRELEGKVVDGEGSPVIDAWVHAASSAGTLASVVTDSEGQFSIPGALPNVHYDVRVESSGGEAMIAGAQPGQELIARVQRAAELSLVPTGLEVGTAFEVAYRGHACEPQRGTLRDSSAGAEWRSPPLCPGRWQFLIWTTERCALTEIELEAGDRQRRVVALNAGDSEACKAFWSAEPTATR